MSGAGLLAAALLAQNAAAETLAWGGMSDSWFVEGNWDTGTVPVAGDLLNIDAGKAIIAEGEAAAGEVRLGSVEGGAGALEMSGGTLTLNGVLQLGYVAGSTGSFTLSGGDLTTSAKTRVGRHGKGIFEMTGGTFTTSADFEVPAYADATATMRILGGTLTQTYGWVNLGLAASSAGTLEVGSGGTLAITMSNGRLYLGRNATGAGYATLRTDGTIAATHVNGSTLATFTFDGGTLQAVASTTEEDPFLAVPPTITANGARIDSQAFDVQIGVNLTGDGGLTKLGAGSLTLTGTNTYAGATVISAGTLVVPSPDALPGYDEPNRITVADGAHIIAGNGWTADDVAALKANVTYLGEGEFTVGTEYDTSNGDQIISDDLTLVDGFTKKGPNMLKLTGHNTFGAAPIVQEGTLQADFGQGLDASQSVVLQGGTLSSTTGTLAPVLGSGAGEVSVLGGVGGFTARGTPLTVSLGEDTLAFATNDFPFTTLILNASDADALLTWTTPLDLNGATTDPSLRTDAGTAVFAAPFTDSTSAGKLYKRGAGTLLFTGDVTQNRIYSEAGNLAFSNNTVQAAYIKADAANGRVDFIDAAVTTTGDGLNLYNGSLCDFSGSSTATLNIFNSPNGTATLGEGSAFTISDHFYGASGSFTQNGGTSTFNTGDRKFALGNTAGSAYTYTLNGGTLTATGTISVGLNSTGTFIQNGGELSESAYIFHGHDAGGFGYGYYKGGTTTLTSADGGTFAAGYNGNGFVTVSDDAQIDINYMMWIGRGNSCTSGVVRLEGGTVSVPQIRGTNNNPGGANRALIFDGGTLKAKPATDKGKYVVQDGTLIRELTHLWMADNGGTIDTDGNDVTIAQPITGNGELIHRWSFNDGTATDEITGTAGTASGFYSFEDQSVKLSGGAYGNSSLDLGANMIPAIDEPFTIEIWATENAALKNSRIFDIGAGENNFFMMNWSMGTDTSKVQFELRHDGTASVTNSCLGGIGLSREYHFTITAGPGEDGRWVFTAYKHYATGELRSTASFTADEGWTPTHLVQHHFYLGHSQFANDNDANATYNEIRVWNRILTPEEQQTCVDLGPDVVPVLAAQSAKSAMKPFIKAGAGTLTLTGTNTYYVATRVAGGTLALAEGASLPPQNDMTVDAEATLDLGTAAVDFGRLAGEGTIVGRGALTAADGIYPGNDNGFGTLTVEAPSLAGTLHVSGGADGACSTLAIASSDEEPSPFNLADLSLVVDDFDSLEPGTVYTIVEAPQGFTGSFAKTNVAGTHWNVQVSATTVTLRKPGFSIILR